MNIEIIKTDEFEGLKVNHRLFKIGDNIKVETDMNIDHKEGRLMSVIPEIQSFSIDYDVNGHTEAKPFFIKDVLGIHDLDYEEMQDIIKLATLDMSPLAQTAAAICGMVVDKDDISIVKPFLIDKLNSSKGFDNIELHDDHIELKRKDEIDIFRKGDMVSVIEFYQPYSGELTEISSVDNTISIKFEIDYKKHAKIFKIDNINDIK